MVGHIILATLTREFVHSIYGQVHKAHVSTQTLFAYAPPMDALALSKASCRATVASGQAGCRKISSMLKVLHCEGHLSPPKSSQGKELLRPFLFANCADRISRASLRVRIHGTLADAHIVPVLHLEMHHGGAPSTT